MVKVNLVSQSFFLHEKVFTLIQLRDLTIHIFLTCLIRLLFCKDIKSLFDCLNE